MWWKGDNPSVQWGAPSTAPMSSQQKRGDDQPVRDQGGGTRHGREPEGRQAEEQEHGGQAVHARLEHPDECDVRVLRCRTGPREHGGGECEPERAEHRQEQPTEKPAYPGRPAAQTASRGAAPLPRGVPRVIWAPAKRLITSAKNRK